MIVPATSYLSLTKELLTVNMAPGAKVMSKNRLAACGLHSQYLSAYFPPDRCFFPALNCSCASPVAAIIGHATFTGFDLAVINLPQMLRLVKLPTKAYRCRKDLLIIELMMIISLVSAPWSTIASFVFLLPAGSVGLVLSALH